MRKLAADLGVAATSIYWHIGQRDEVVAAVLARHASQLRDLPVEGKTGHDRVFSAAKNVWSSSLRHSNLSRLAHQAGSSDQAQPLLDALLGELAATGMDPEDAARLLRVLVNTVAGFLVQALRTDGAVAPGFDAPRLATPTAGDSTRPTSMRPAGRSTRAGTRRGAAPPHPRRLSALPGTDPGNAPSSPLGSGRQGSELDLDPGAGRHGKCGSCRIDQRCLAVALPTVPTDQTGDDLVVEVARDGVSDVDGELTGDHTHARPQLGHCGKGAGQSRTAHTRHRGSGPGRPGDQAVACRSLTRNRPGAGRLHRVAAEVGRRPVAAWQRQQSGRLSHTKCSAAA